jgi:hypothetical protein
MKLFDREGNKGEAERRRETWLKARLVLARQFGLFNRNSERGMIDRPSGVRRDWIEDTPTAQRGGRKPVATERIFKAGDRMYDAQRADKRGSVRRGRGER